MAASGSQTIQLYYSTSSGTAPVAGNLANGELAINITDGKLYYKDNSGVVQTMATKGTALIGGSNTQVQYNNNGTLAGSGNLTFDGTTLTANSLTVTNNPTLSAGTANGVLYLNGSKVATSGSALTFDGTNFATTGNIDSGSAKNIALNATSSSDTNRLQWKYQGTAYAWIERDNSTGGMAFTVQSAEAMRLTSTGLGIGTSSPGNKLSVNSGASTTIANFTSTGSAAYLALANSGATTFIGNDSTSGSFIIQTPSGGFSTKLTLDNSGNLGLGVTPSAWYTGYTAQNIGYSGAIWSNRTSSDTNTVMVGLNSYLNSGATNWIYQNNGNASRYVQVSGQHQWHTAASGTAGNAITWTQAMTLDANGKLGIGNTSPDLTLDVYGPNGTNGDANRVMVVLTTNTATAGIGGGIAFGGYYNGTTNKLNDFAGIQGFKENSTAGDYAGALRFTTRVNGGSPTERMRITSAGDVGIGVTSPSNYSGWTTVSIGNTAGGEIDFYSSGTNVSQIYGGSLGTYISTIGGRSTIFTTNGLERARIDSSGNLGIGTSSPSDKLTTVSNNSTGILGSGSVVFSGTTYYHAQLLLKDSADRTMAIRSPSGIINAQVGTTTNHNLELLTGNTIRATVDTSGNFGIGTGSPSTWNTKLVVYNNQLTVTGGGYDGTFADSIYFGGNAEGTTYRNKISNSISSIASSQMMKFSIANGASTWVDVMTLNGAGNVGIGTSSPSAKLEIYNSAVNGAFVPNTLSTWRVAQIRNDQSGTSGSAAGIAFVGKSDTQPAGIVAINGNTTGGVVGLGFLTVSSNEVFERMRLDSSGNLGLGVTPSAWSTASKPALQLPNGASLFSRSGATALSQNFYYNSSDVGTYIANGYATFYFQTSGQHQWFNAPSGIAGNTASFTQAMTLGADGLLQVGTTTGSAPDGKLQVSATGTGSGAANTVVGFNCFEETSGNKAGIWLGAMTNSNVAVIGSRTASGSIAFQTYDGGWGERARITSSGNLLVGTTSGSTNIFFRSGDTSNPAFIVRNGNTSGNTYGINVNFNGSAPNNTTSWFLQCNDTGAERATIRSNGGIANYQANDANLSDRREKTNFAPAGEYLSKICAIPVQTFNYIDQAQDDPGLTLGVVAQDVQSVAPELVMESNWGTEENPKMRLSIYQTDLQYALMKSIQELKAELDSVKAELAQLKGA